MWYVIRNDNSELYHYGVKGMKWGIRRSKNTSHSGNSRMRLNLQYFGRRAKALKTVKISDRERARVMHELRSNISRGQKKLAMFSKPIGTYTYTFENHFDDTYRIVGRKKIPQSTTGILKRFNDGKK